MLVDFAVFLLLPSNREQTGFIHEYHHQWSSEHQRVCGAQWHRLHRWPTCCISTCRTFVSCTGSGVIVKLMIHVHYCRTAARKSLYFTCILYLTSQTMFRCEAKLTDLCAAGMLFAQKPAAPAVSQTVMAAGTSGFSALSSSHSPTSSSSTSSKGPN